MRATVIYLTFIIVEFVEKVFISFSKFCKRFIDYTSVTYSCINSSNIIGVALIAITKEQFHHISPDNPLPLICGKHDQETLTACS